MPGEVLLAEVAIQGAGAASGIITVPNGWTRATPDVVCGSDFQMSLAYRVSQAADTAATQFTWNFSGQFLGAGGVVSFAKGNITTPIEATSSLCLAGSLSPTAPSLATSADNSLNVLVFGISGNNFLSKPAGYSQIFEHVIGGSGPVIANDVNPIAKSGTTTGDQTAPADLPGDSIGYQLVLPSAVP